MNRPIDLFLHFWNLTAGGTSWVSEDDMPSTMAAVYGVVGEPDESAMLAATHDINGLVALGWIQKHVRAGLVIFVITSKGKAERAQIQDVSATADTPAGPL